MSSIYLGDINIKRGISICPHRSSSDPKSVPESSDARMKLGLFNKSLITNYPSLNQEFRVKNPDFITEIHNLIPVKLHQYTRNTLYQSLTAVIIDTIRVTHESRFICDGYR